MNKYIRTILMVVLTIISYISVYGESSTSEIRKLLDDVDEYLAEKPDSAFSVLNALEIPESEDGETMAFYAILHARAEYIVTDTIKSDSLLLEAIKYYNGERSLKSSLAYYYLGCCYFGADYYKASYAFQRAIDLIPDGNDTQKGRSYHALGSCYYANGNFKEGNKAYKTALAFLDEKASEDTWKLCQNIKMRLNNDAAQQRANIHFALFVTLIMLLLVGLSVFAYIMVKKKHPVNEGEIESSDDPLEQKLKEGKQKFEDTASYKILQEIRSLNERELSAITDIDTKAIEGTIIASFNDAYHILAEYDAKISHQDIMLCLYGYLKFSNNVAAFCLKSVPGTIRQRKNRLKGKLPETAYDTIFSQQM